MNYNKSLVLKDFLSLAKKELNANGNIGFTMPDNKYHIFVYVDYGTVNFSIPLYVIEPNKVVDGAHEPMGNTKYADYDNFEELLIACAWCIDEFEQDIESEKERAFVPEEEFSISMDLGFAKLIAVKGSDPDYKEIFVGLEDYDGSWAQDLAVIGENYHYTENLDKVQDKGVIVRVYSDKNTDDYTHKFVVDAYEPELESSLDEMVTDADNRNIKSSQSFDMHREEHEKE